MKYISYDVPKGNSYGHSLGKMKIIECYDRVSRFTSANNAVGGNTVMVGIYKKSEVGFDVSELFIELDLIIQDFCKDAPANHAADPGLKDGYISYQWSQYRLPLEMLRYFEGRMDELEENGLDISMSEDFRFHLHRDGKILEEYERYKDPNLRKLRSHMGVMYGNRQFVQPRIVFPFDEYSQSAMNCIANIENYKIFKFNRNHLRIYHIGDNGKSTVRKITN